MYLNIVLVDGSVDTVCLYSNVSLNEIDNIYLDYQSKTSVELLKILCKEYWKISPNLKNSKNGFEEKVKDNVVALIIGDLIFSQTININTYLIYPRYGNK